MNLLFIAFLLFVHNIKDLQAEQNSTEYGSQNKTKRTVSPTLIHNYGENKPLLYYNDNGGSSSDFSSLYMPVKSVFDSEIPKQVAAQQVLYEFQQTPTNAVSNVHVNQFYQPVPNQYAQKQQSINHQQQQQQQNSQPPTQTGSETVVNPVHHSTLIRHNQNLAPVHFQQPPIPHHVQTQQYIPGKYFYVNGKILYQPHQLNHPQQQQQQQPIQLSRSPNYPIPQVQKQKILPPISPLQPPTLLPRPFSSNNFNPPQQHHYQKITKPISTIVNHRENTKNEEEIENDKIPVKEEDVEAEEEEEEDDDVENSEADEESDDEDNDDEIEDPRNFFHKYSFNDDEDEDDHHHEDDDDDDDDYHGDNSRKASKQASKKHKNKSKSNKFNDHHHHHYKASKTNKKKRQHDKSPKIKYQAMKYIRNGNSKPKIEYIEGRQSKHIPIIHKQKLFKEKWYVSKSTDDLAGA